MKKIITIQQLKKYGSSYYILFPQKEVDDDFNTKKHHKFIIDVKEIE